jgi:hypothetical protein
MKKHVFLICLLTLTAGSSINQINEPLAKRDESNQHEGLKHVSNSRLNYDHTLADLQNFSSVSHEVILGKELTVYKNRILSTRYF